RLNHLQAMRGLWPLFLLFSFSLAINRPMEFHKIDEVMEMWTEYSHIHGVIDYIVDELCEEYPELHPGSEENMILLKREIVYVYELPEKEKAEIFAGFPSKYTLVSSALQKLMKIGRALKPLNSAEKEFKDHNLDQYALFKTMFPLTVEHLEMRKDYYLDSGMTKEEIQKDLGKETLKFIDEWHKDDPEEALIEASRERVREKYEL
ncbi:hypothetical protein PMAYCL1PPCAC_06077, partial [Pristionchus mayeri]